MRVMHAKLNYYHGTKLLLTYYRTQHRYNQLKNARLSNRVVLDHGGEMNVDERSVTKLLPRTQLLLPRTKLMFPIGELNVDERSIGSSAN